MQPNLTRIFRLCPCFNPSTSNPLCPSLPRENLSPSSNILLNRDPLRGLYSDSCLGKSRPSSEYALLICSEFSAEQICLVTETRGQYLNFAPFETNISSRLFVSVVNLSPGQRKFFSPGSMPRTLSINVKYIALTL